MDGLVSVIRQGNRLKEVKQFLGGHIAGKWQSFDLCPSLSDSRAHAFITPPFGWPRGEDQRDNFLEICFRGTRLRKMKEGNECIFLNLTIFTNFNGREVVVELWKSVLQIFREGC